MSHAIEGLIAMLPAAFQAEHAKGVDTVIQLNVTGLQMGHWNFVIKDGKLTTAKGIHPAPKVTITASTDDIVAVADGKLDPAQAFSQGKAKVAGDLNEAVQLIQLFRIKEHA
jgi:putative sterol carrier protein